MKEEIFFNEFTAPKQISIVKEKKIYQRLPAHAAAARIIRNVGKRQTWPDR